MNNFEEFTVNYDKVIAARNYNPIVRMTALQLRQNPYMTIGDFFKQLGDADIDVLASMVDQFSDNQLAAQQLVLLSEMLSRAEGTEASDQEGCAKNLNAFCMFITCVSLERKGLVRVFYENLSFGEDMESRPIVQKLGF